MFLEALFYFYRIFLIHTFNDHWSVNVLQSKSKNLDRVEGIVYLLFRLWVTCIHVMDSSVSSDYRIGHVVVFDSEEHLGYERIVHDRDLIGSTSLEYYFESIKRKFI